VLAPEWQPSVGALTLADAVAFVAGLAGALYTAAAAVEAPGAALQLLDTLQEAFAHAFLQGELSPALMRTYALPQRPQAQCRTGC
jgi:hypothetical protein